MVEIEQENQRAFVVRFRDLHLWSTNSFYTFDWRWNPNDIKPLSAALKRKIVEVDRRRVSFESLNLVTLHFDGIMEPRDLHGKNNFKGKLFLANPGDVIYSKIDVRNGAIGVVPNDFPIIAVSSEYPVYEVLPDVANADYIRLLFRTNVFQQRINSMISGASGRKRVQPTQLEDIEVPLPSVEIQEGIVAYWRTAKNRVVDAGVRVKALEEEIGDRFLGEIGIKKVGPPKQKKAFTIHWSNLERWDLFFHRPDFHLLEEQLDDLNAVQLSDVLNFASRPWKKSDFPGGKFEYVEISAVTKERGIFSSRTVEIKNAPSRATTLIKKGDLIISTTRPYLGAITIVPEEYDNCVCSSGFALVTSLKMDDLDLRYVLFFLTSWAGLLQLERRMTGGLYPAIVQDELEKIRLPLPPIKVQQEILHRFEEGLEVIRNEREFAEQVARDTKTEIDQLIVGSIKMNDLQGL